MADGRHFEKTVKSLYLCNRLTDFDEIWYSDAHWTGTADVPLKFRILKIQDGGGRYLEKSQKSRYLRNGLTDLYKFGKLMQNWFLNRSTVKKIRISQIQDGGHLPF